MQRGTILCVFQLVSIYFLHIHMGKAVIRWGLFHFSTENINMTLSYISSVFCIVYVENKEGDKNPA